MPRVKFVKKARKPNSVVSKEDIAAASKKDATDKEKARASYYWWKFRFGGRRESKTYPKASQLTQSEYLGRVYDMQDKAGEEPDYESLEDWVQEFIDEVSEMRDEQEEKIGNLQEYNLENSPSGEQVQERLDACESAISDLESIDIPTGDYADEEDDPEPEEGDKSTWGEDDDYKTAHSNWEERKQTWESEKVSEVASEVSSAIDNLSC